MRHTILTLVKQTVEWFTDVQKLTKTNKLLTNHDAWKRSFCKSVKEDIGYRMFRRFLYLNACNSLSYVVYNEHNKTTASAFAKQLNVKVSSYIPQYPVLWTTQSNLFPSRPV